MSKVSLTLRVIKVNECYHLNKGTSYFEGRDERNPCCRLRKMIFSTAF